MSYAVVERKNRNAIHAITDTRASAEKWISEKAPEYSRLGFFMDKTLKPSDFVVVPHSFKKRVF